MSVDGQYGCWVWKRVRSKDEWNHFSLLRPYFFQRSRIYVVPPSPFTSLRVRSSFRFVRQQAFLNMRAQKSNVEYITCSYSSHVPQPEQSIPDSSMEFGSSVSRGEQYIVELQDGGNGVSSSLL
jgi:hypothetical protein